MKLVTWNVNSIRAREERLLRWLDQHQPDVLCLQELKCREEGFPFDAVRQRGYHVTIQGQPTYNGVAILSRTPPQDERHGLGDAVEDPQARLVSANIDGTDVICAYVPNGSQPDSEKYRYKLQWLRRLEAHLQRHHTPDTPLALCGDLNIAPDDSDVARPQEWGDTVLCAPEVREAFKRLLDWGLRDVFRLHHPEGGHYSWWDYRMLGFPKNNGLRIDHILATTPLAERCLSASIDRDERKGKQPSDHAPVVATFR